MTTKLKPDRRVIEDILPIGKIGAQAAKERNRSHKHINSLHKWWARRPLVVCRAAVYGALVSSQRFIDNNDSKQQDVAWNTISDFIEKLCEYSVDAQTLKVAQSHIKEDHIARINNQSEFESTQDLRQGKNAPRVLDMFAGGGGIPLEALRLGCDAYAFDLNPVAHIVQLCSLVYPQKHLKADLNTSGAAGVARNGKVTWGGLDKEIIHWGKRILEMAKNEISDLYPNVPNPNVDIQDEYMQLSGASAQNQSVLDELVPLAYRWTRTVPCKNGLCGATVPMAKNTWLHTTKSKCVALKPLLSDDNGRKIAYKVVKQTSAEKFDFDPSSGSVRSSATCKFCGTVADIEYVKRMGNDGQIGFQLMGTVCGSPNKAGREYYSADDYPYQVPDECQIQKRIGKLVYEKKISLPTEPVPPKHALGFTPSLYGIREWKDLFTSRQLLCMLTFVDCLKEVEDEMNAVYSNPELGKSVLTYLAVAVDRLADVNSNMCRYNHKGVVRVVETFSRSFISMVWDFGEINPFGCAGSNWFSCLSKVVNGMLGANTTNCGHVQRGCATKLPWPNEYFDAIITDPPYYDNVPYAYNSDFFYVWLKRTIGHLYPDHFAAQLTPKKSEVVAEPNRYDGDRNAAKNMYEHMMLQAFSEAHRALKADSPFIVVYAHKTTHGWATLLNALRDSGFVVTEAWPLNTEDPGRLRAQNASALASSIFLVSRKRIDGLVGSYELDVQPELLEIVTRRVDELWRMGISGADLVIAAIGAGLRAYSRYSVIEYENGEVVPAEKFLMEVEGATLEALLGKIFGVSKRGISTVDNLTRLYVVWRYTQKDVIGSGDAIVLKYGLAVELDDLSRGKHALVEQDGSKIRLKDFSERGRDKKLGLPGADGEPAPLIDVLHRVLWLVENDPNLIGKALADGKPDNERLRLLAQVLAGTALDGSRSAATTQFVGASGAEQMALHKLLANWRTLVDTPSIFPLLIQDNAKSAL